MKEDKDNDGASDLMKVVAEKVPSKKKIEKDFSPAEQAEIYGKIRQNQEKEEEVKKAGSNGEPEEDTAVTDAERKERAVKAKHFAKELEAENRSKIIIFPSYSRIAEDKWYKMGDFSALYYAFRMSSRMDRKEPTIQKDKDRFARMKSIVSIRDIDKFVADAMKLEDFRKYEKTLNGVYILYLKKALEDDDVAALYRTSRMKKEMMHSVVRPKKAVPEMYLAILALSRQIMHLTMRLPVVYRFEIGDRVARYMVEIVEIYYEYAGKFREVEDAKREIKMRLIWIKAALAILGEGDTVKPEGVCMIGETILRVEALAEEMK